MIRIVRWMAASALLVLSAADAKLVTTPSDTIPSAQDLSRFQIRKPIACDQLIHLGLVHTDIVSAQIIPAGSYTPVAGGTTFKNLPSFCRVVGFSHPSKVSNIGFEVWMPLGKKYNQRFEQVGNGGFAGVIGYDDLAAGIRRGFATASTDDGHQGFQDSTFARGEPEKIIDFGYRAIKETTDRAKALIQAFYAAAPKFSYFVGCSDGGREALMTAQRNPNDFDGIIAGAPANHWTHQFAGLAWDVQAAYDHATLAALMSPANLATLSAAVRAQCAGHDGGLSTDKFLTDPRACTINWSLIQCAPGQDPLTCLSPAQIAAVKAIYAGPSDPVTHAQIYPGYEPGSEDAVGGWQAWITGPLGFGPFPTFGLGTFFGEGFLANFVFNLPLYNMMLFNFSTDMPAVDALSPTLNSADPNLAPFQTHGGKLIQYAGWADPAVAPRDSIAYYDQVRSAMALTVNGEQGFYRLFMAPGLCHCTGGPGPNSFGNNIDVPPPIMDADHDVLLALMHWREDGVAPATIIATKYVGDNPAAAVDGQRPLCAYPAKSHYLGLPHDPKLAASYECVARGRLRP